MPDLPSGTVTFLFSDIEGSTRLARAHPSEWEPARLAHHALLRAAAEAHHGTVFRIVGDAFCIAFLTALEALSAAYDAQRALYSTFNNPQSINLRVRMALHTGAAEPSDGDYRAYVVLSHLARLLAAAAGGQVLLSEATHSLLREPLPVDLSLLDLGEVRLKDFPAPEHVYQLLAPGLPSDFPPLSGLRTTPNNLPVQLTSFVGRAAELAEVRALLSGARLLTLTGSGGTGKTRLALEVAKLELSNFHAGVWFVDLAPLADPALVPQTMAALLGVPEQPGRPVSAGLADYLRGKDCLLLLDNCEHLVDAAARLADTLLHAAPDIKILATGRELLGIAGESAYRVPSLPCPAASAQLPVADLLHFDAIQLFVTRAAAVRPQFAVTAANAPAVAQICIRLDGIPLAIELAAARIGLFAPEQIASRLDDRFRLLTGGSRTALPRQQTLRNAIDWSFSLLSPQERVLLRRLAIFTGGWLFEAAEAICADDTDSTPEIGADLPFLKQVDVLELHAHLVEKSLVVADERDGETRYRMLETIRRFALDKLIDAAEVELLRKRHEAYFRQLAATMFASGNWRAAGFDVTSRALREHDNWRAALDWDFSSGQAELGVALAAHLAIFWEACGLLKEGRTWLEQALSRQIGQRTLRATVLRGLGVIESRQGDFSAAARHTGEAAAIWSDLGNTPGLADALHFLGHATFDQQKYELARQYFEESRMLYERLGESRNVYTLFADVGLVAYHLGDYADAERRFTQALTEARRLAHADRIGLLLLRLGDLSRIAGDDQRARAQYEESLRLHRELHANLELASSLHKLAQLARKRGESGLAQTYLRESIGLQRESGNRQGIAECLAAFAALAMESDATLAAQLFGASEALLAEIGAPLAPADRLDVERDVARLRTQLESPAFDKAWAAGRALSIDQAIALALAPIPA